MGLFNKIKNILFEEEVIEETVQKEEKKVAEPKIEPERKPRLFDLEEDIPKIVEHMARNRFRTDRILKCRFFSVKCENLARCIVAIIGYFWYN